MRDPRSFTITAPVPSPRILQASPRVTKQEDTANIPGGFIASGVASVAAVPTAIASKGSIIQNH